WQERLAALHDLVFRPVDEQVIAPACRALPDGACTVLIVPHGLLNLVSFAALVLARDGDPAHAPWPRPRYLVDRYAVAYAPSVSALAEIVAGERKSERSLLVTYPGEDLPAVRREVDRLKQVLPEVEELTGQAPHDTLTTALASRRVVLIAAHGVLSP